MGSLNSHPWNFHKGSRSPYIHWFQFILFYFAGRKQSLVFFIGLFFQLKQFCFQKESLWFTRMVSCVRVVLKDPWVTITYCAKTVFTVAALPLPSERVMHKPDGKCFDISLWVAPNWNRQSHVQICKSLISKHIARLGYGIGFISDEVDCSKSLPKSIRSRQAVQA